ncbi:hypothetical protein EYR36_006042 [Pleurotus pulmonarius]|nr:hypothetical protein EYR36_006042 [Pleurotus pulmonarius]KAF4600748.1 hypothetical protein EYR38_005393 [Pleurotus pulmonarius]
MPLGEESITSFFKPTGRTSDNYKSLNNQARDNTKRARNLQDGTDSKAEISRKKAKPSPTPQARASGTGKLHYSPSGSQTLLTDLLQRKKDDAPKQSTLSRSAKSKRKSRPSVIDLTNNNENDTEDADTTSTAEPSNHHSSMNLASGPVGFTSTCPSYRPNVLDIPSFGTINTARGPSGRLDPDNRLSPPHISFFDAVPSSQSQDLQRELPLEPAPSSSRHAPSPWYMSPATEPPASPPFTPRKKQKAAFPDVLSSPAVPSSQTQELCTFDSPTTLRTSPAVRSSQTQPLYLLDTPTSAHASPIVASSQTQAFCMFDTPTKHRPPPSQRRMSSDGNHEDIAQVPEKDISMRLASASDGIEPHASPIPALRSLDSPSESRAESCIRSTEYLPPATPSDARTPLQEDNSNHSDDGNLADDSLPIFDSQVESQSSDDPSQVINNFFNIFDEGGSSLPTDFPIPLR